MKLVKAVLQPVLICIIISLLGCSGHSPTSSNNEMASASMADEMNTGDGAALFVFNQSGWTLLPQDEVVLDNGQELVSMPRNTFARIIIPAGAHVFGFPYRTKPTLSIDAVKGQTYYIQVIHKSRTSWAYSIEGDPIEIKQLSEAEAKSLMDKLEPLPTPAKEEMESEPAAEEQVPEIQAGQTKRKAEPPSPAANMETPSTPAAEERVPEIAAQPAKKKAASPPMPAKEEMASAPVAEEGMHEMEAEPMMEKTEPPPIAAREETPSAPPTEKRITGDNATLFILNVSGWTLLPKAQTVLDNGNMLVRLQRNIYTKVNISAGVHNLGFPNREKPTLTLDAAKGGTYYVSIAYKPQSTWFAPTATDPIEIKQLSEKEAISLMKGLAYQ